MKKYKVQKIETAYGGTVHVADNITIDGVDWIVSISTDQPGRNMLKDIQNFENYLMNLPPWCTPEMAQEALQSKFPERYL